MGQPARPQQMQAMWWMDCAASRAAELLEESRMTAPDPQTTSDDEKLAAEISFPIALLLTWIFMMGWLSL
jgi:hypothetical protein